MAWHRSWKAGLGLRLLGLLCGWGAWLAFLHLFALSSATKPPDALQAALATAGFVLASAGAALIGLGHHLFDEIEVSSRWRRGAMDDVASRASFLMGER